VDRPLPKRYQPYVQKRVVDYLQVVGVSAQVLNQQLNTPILDKDLTHVFVFYEVDNRRH
jgi:hypothetical protein